MFIFRLFFNYVLLVSILIGGGFILMGYGSGYSTHDMYAMTYNVINAVYTLGSTADWTIANLDNISDKEFFNNLGCIYNYVNDEFVKVCGNAEELQAYGKNNAVKIFVE